LTEKNKLARNKAWEMGVVAPWYLRKSQLDIYRLLMSEKFAFIEAARRFGKTTSLLAFVLEKLRQNPGWICRWCFPNKNQAREVLGAEIEKLQRDCPERLRFKYQTTDSVYLGPDSSKLYIRGVNEDRGDSARGPASNIIVCDEYGFWNEPDYIVREVLFPQLEKQSGQWLIKASTPPRNLGHRYYTEREEAIRKNRFIQKTIYQNEALSPDEIEVIIEESGGIDSPAFRRERLCEPVSDPSMLIVPEWKDELNAVPDDYPRPDFYTPYVGGDSGADDNTAVLFGYHDFIKNEVVIEDELVTAGRTTKDIIDEAKTVEARLWGGSIDKSSRPITPRKRVYDAPKQLIFDIFTEHKWPVQMPQKEDKHAAIHEFRVEVGARRFKVKERCKHLRNQLKVGMWRDEKHQDFERTEGLGHLDAIAAAIYFNRCIDVHHNPWPLNPGVSQYTHFIPPVQPGSQGKSEQALNKVFGSRAGRFK
jgi:hypothetical protein